MDVIPHSKFKETREDFDELRRLYPSISHYTLGYNARRKALGVCSNTERRIYISQYLLTSTREAIKDTLIHEVAHARNRVEYGGRGHDARWSMLFRQMGGTGNRCSSGEKARQFREEVAKVAKYTLTCPVCSKTVSKHAMSRRGERNYSCGLCAPRRYDEKYKLVVTQNY